MSEKTNTMRWLPWVVSLVIAAAIILLTWQFRWYQYLVTPWQQASGIAINIAISDYNLNNMDPEAFQLDRYEAIVRMIVVLVIGPAFWIIGEIRSQNFKRSNRKGWMWFVGTVIVILGLFTGIFGSYRTYQNYQNAEQRFEMNMKSNEMSGALNDVAYELYEYYHLPKQYGGGGSSFEVFEEKGKALLKKLDSYNKHSAFDFVIDNVDPDSSITVYVVSPAKGTNPDFKNINGETGYMQKRIIVYPTYDQVEFDHRQQNTR